MFSASYVIVLGNVLSVDVHGDFNHLRDEGETAGDMRCLLIGPTTENRISSNVLLLYTYLLSIDRRQASVRNSVSEQCLHPRNSSQLVSATYTFQFVHLLPPLSSHLSFTCSPTTVHFVKRNHADV